MVGVRAGGTPPAVKHMSNETQTTETVPAKEAAWRQAENIATQRTNHGVEEEPTYTPADGLDGWAFRMTHPDHEARYVEVVFTNAFPEASDPQACLEAELPAGDETDQETFERAVIWEGDVDDPDLVATF